MYIPFIGSVKKHMKRWERTFAFSKRQQFVGVTFVLTLGLFLTQLVPVEWRYPMVALLSAGTYAGAAFGLRDDLAGIEWVTLLTLPTLFTAAVGLFYFLLPVRWLTRVPVATIYAIGMYGLLLTENIYNVAANRTIALLRAAHSVGFLLTLTTYFLLVQTVLAFRFSPVINAAAIGTISILLIFQTLWAIELEETVNRRVTAITVALTIVCMELAWIFSFWPVKSIIQALFLTTCFYSLVGMGQQYLAQRLYKRTVIEFFAVSAIVFVVVLFTTHWRGNF